MTTYARQLADAVFFFACAQEHRALAAERWEHWYACKSAPPLGPEYSSRDAMQSDRDARRCHALAVEYVFGPSTDWLPWREQPVKP